MRPRRLGGRVVVVTGGARGQGAAAVRAMHGEGASVLVTDLREDEGRTLAAELGERCEFAPHDVCDEQGWDGVLSTAHDRFGAVTGVVNCAGVFTPTALRDTASETFRRTMEVNATGSFLALRAAARSMTGGGSVVLVTSTAAHMPSGLGLVGYTASKWAVRGMAHSAAVELAGAGIRVNTVAPGAVSTPMITDTLTSEALSALAARIPLGRLGVPEEIAPLVTFLISDDSRYCTGADFVVDGGMTAGFRSLAARS